ncbi:GSCOCG00012598001-RA-CDS [Cotesia congregata]|nr:GSCOCG00012598001-RA-CDS [Cotesia congregata]
MPKFFDRCCNPFILEKHRKKISLRNLSEHLAIRYNLSTDERICSSCYKKMLQPSIENTSDESDDNQNNDYFGIDQNIISGSIEVYDSERNNLTEPTTSYGESLVKQSSSSLSELSLEITRPTINDALQLLNQPPLLTRRQNDDTYLNNKITRVAYNLRKALGVQNAVKFQCSDTDAAEIIEKLR